MRVLFLSVFYVCCNLVFSCACSSQETKSPDNVLSPVAAKEESTPATIKPAQQYMLRVRTTEKVDFAGIVTAVDVQSAIISVRNQSKTISFDMSKSVCIGYRDIGEIKQGDRVSVGYTKYGLQIRKGSFAVSNREKLPNPRKTPEQQPGTMAKAKPGIPIRMMSSTNNRTFSGIDNNKDGKLSPIELCILIQDLTLETFRQFDRNGDGFLNQQEFSSAKLGR